MFDPGTPEPQTNPASSSNQAEESFSDLLSRYERPSPDSGGNREGVVIAVSGDSILLDIGFKTEGILPGAAFAGGVLPKPGDKLPVTVKGRDPEGYYQLARGRVERPTDWSALEKAFAEKAVIAGTVTGVIKGGLSVDIGVRAFMPASRSGVRETAEIEKLVGQEIRCRIIKLDVTEEDVVVDRRAISEEEEAAVKERRFLGIAEGETVSGVVRSLADYGAFIDIGGIDGLLHVSDISWQRVSEPSDVLSPGQEIEARVLKIDPEKRRISLGMKQLQPHPWDSAAEKYKVGERVRGTVTRVSDFGAFAELEPGVEGLIHISEMSWSKKVRKPGDVVRPGDGVEVVVLGLNQSERRISLGLKQALGDPWADAERKFAPGSVVEGPIVRVLKFGAFVQLAEGVEGMIHVSEIADRRINHPQEVLKPGQTVKAQVLALDVQKRMLRLGMKQLIPTRLDEYIAEHREGDIVTGCLIELADGRARVELGDGVQAACRIGEQATVLEEKSDAGKADLTALSSMLQARWKGASAATAKPEPFRAGQVRKFRIAKIDPAAKYIELEADRVQ